VRPGSLPAAATLGAVHDDRLFEEP